MTDVRDIPREFLEVGLYSIGLIALVGAVVCLVSLPFSAALGLDWVNLAFFIGLTAGLAMAAVLFFAIRRAFGLLRRYFEHELAMDEAEHEPREIVKVIERAAGPLVITSGLSPEQVVKIGGIDKRDLAWFTEQMVATKDWTAKRWEGVTLPNGFKITNKNTNGDASPTSYAKLIQLYVDCGAITDRSPGQTGKLAVTDVGHIMTLLESHFKAQNKPT